MKKLGFVLSLFVAAFSFGQDEIVSPLLTNPSVKAASQVKTGGSIHGLFVYNIDTLNLPVFDDFSTDRFIPYNAQISDPNVSSTEYFRLMDASNTNALASDTIFCDSTHAHLEVVSIVSGISITTTSYFTTPLSVWVNDLTAYPVQGQLRTLYNECYVLVDSIIDGVPDPDQDTIWYTASPDFVQDSATVYLVDYSDPSTVWIDQYAYHNYTYAVNPWSLGVATLDGVDENGWPYDFGNTSAHESADVLTSRPINLAGKTGVYITFIYQQEGYGNAPEEDDSLILEWWLPDSNAWYPSQWYALGGGTTDGWDTTHWAVPTAALDNGFRFRFRNWASTSGNLDHWHIDYVNLVDNQTPVTDPFNDLAISMPISTLLKTYTAVPWDHYKNLADPLAVMKDSVEMNVFNSSTSSLAYDPNNNFLEIRYNGVHDGASPYVLGNVGLNSFGWSGNWDALMSGYPYSVFGLGYAFEESVTTDDQATFDIKYIIAENTPGQNLHPENDTNYVVQDFRNYYAYDDGSAEAAYGITGSHSLLAYKFDAYESDSLAGVLMYWVPSVENHEDKTFLLTIWNDNGGVPGDIIYQDDYFNTNSPEYSGGLNAFRYYTFMNDQKILVPATFYIGWEQIESASLNIGLDLNTDHGDKIFRNTTGTWQTSSYDASVMIRPVFSTAMDNTLNLDETAVESSILVYPNPVNDQVNIIIAEEEFSVTLRDMSGRVIAYVLNETSLDMTELTTGVYLLEIRDENGALLHTSKLIKN